MFLTWGEESERAAKGKRHAQTSSRAQRARRRRRRRFSPFSRENEMKLNIFFSCFRVFAT